MRTRCGKCPACLTPDCGKCEPCSKKKKFGGDGSSKHACIFRRCTNLQVNVVRSSHSNGGGGRRKRSNSSSSSHGKAVPTTTKTKSSASSPDDKWHVHPRSLLASRLPKRARIAAGETAFDENSPPPLPSHFSGLPIPVKTLGVCARCKNPSEDAHEPVLLCDGEGCGREYHLKCCLPPIRSIPEGSFYCFDCSTKGATAQLEEYLQEHENRKCRFFSMSDRKNYDHDTHEFVDTLLKEDIELEPTYDEDMRKSRRFPSSELSPFHCTQSVLTHFHQTYPFHLIGKPVRLYCPKGNQYHNGRILNVKIHYKHLKCLIRFPAGQDHRKTPLMAWIYLEEHCAAVATDILWGHFGESKRELLDKKRRSQSTGCWAPAILWRRTSRELVSVAALLSPVRGQIRFRGPLLDSDSIVRKPGAWGLVEAIGTDKYEFLNLRSETRRAPPTQQKHSERKAQLLMSMARAELVAEKRVIKWNQIPLLDPMHKAVLQCQDEYALGVLEYRSRPKQFVNPSPLVAQGLDRSYVMEGLCNQKGVAPSKDFASSLICEIVESVPDSVSMITQRDRKKLGSDI